MHEISPFLFLRIDTFSHVPCCVKKHDCFLFFPSQSGVFVVRATFGLRIHVHCTPFFLRRLVFFFVLDRETRETREKERERTRNTTDRAEKARHGRDRKRACAKEETAGSILSDKRSVIYKANDFFRFSLKVVPCQPCQPR